MGSRPYVSPSFELFVYDFDVRTAVIVESDGSRFTDWYSVGEDETGLLS